MAKFEQKAVIETPKYSHFNLTNECKGTMLMGVGYPVKHMEVLPGDEISISVDQIMRLAPLQSPVFDDVEMHFRAYFVPNRVLDPRWKEFITGGVGLYGSSDQELAPLSFSVDSLVSAQENLRQAPWEITRIDRCAAVGGLADWLNFHFAEYSQDEFQRPVDPSTKEVLTYETTHQEKYSILPFLGYQKIFDDWIRNERIQAERLPDIYRVYEEQSNTRCWMVDYDDLSSISWEYPNPFALWRVNFGKDRYTTALPEPVIGGDIYAVQATDVKAPLQADTDAQFLSSELGTLSTRSVNTDGTVTYNVVTEASVPATRAALYTRLVSAAATTVRQLKMAFKEYSFFMKDTYNGNRYVEFMDSHFDIRVPDATLDRAIYLGDHKIRISFGEVFQTSGGSGEGTEGLLGDYAGRGAAYSEDGFLFKEKFLEHGQLYVIASIVPRACYFQGVDRKFIKTDRFSYFFPEFQNIGDDMLYSKELWNNPADTYRQNERTFGYAPRWSELKESLNEIHGDFLTNMDEYHFARRFANQPVIGERFSVIQTENRPFVVIDGFSENYLANMRFSTHAKRPLLMYETF